MTEYQSNQFNTKYQLEKFINQCEALIRIEKLSIKLDPHNKKATVTKYNNMIAVTQYRMRSAGWEHRSGVSGFAYYQDYYYSEDEKKKFISFINDCNEKIKEIDPEYEIQPAPTLSSLSPSHNSGGCYVATCVYGSYDCPQVWTLRRYRDNKLAKTWHGRAFIYTYYAISPTIVKWFGDTECFKKLWKGKLDRMVSNLQAEGVDSTPYEDREW